MPYGQLNVDSVVNSDGVTSGGLYGFKNRIINGAMMIDQRNNGASINANGYFVVDRTISYFTSGTVNGQRQSGGPSGFSNFVRYTVASAATRNAADANLINQTIEGFNVSDFGLGSAGASSFTFSFWVRSSIAGLYSGCVNSGDNSRGYGFTFTINSANTWEQKTVTITGDISGGTTAWPTGNGSGMLCRIDLGSGSNYQLASAGSWLVATNKGGVGGTVNWAQTAGATFDITGMQLEKGSTATSFDYRPYGTELALCQRYCYAQKSSAGNPYYVFGVSSSNSTTPIGFIKFPVTLRTTPSLSASAGSTFGFASGAPTTINLDQVAEDCAFIYGSGGTGGTPGYSGRLLAANTASAYLIWSAEL